MVNKSSQIAAKIEQNRSKNLPKSVPRPSWRDLGAILAPRWPKTTPRAPKLISLDPLGPRSWRPKSTKNQFRSDVKCDHFFDDFLDQLLKRFGANLVPTWLPKSSQNEAKLASKAIQKAIKQNHKNLQQPLFFTCKWRVRGSQVGAKIDQKSI